VYDLSAGVLFALIAMTRGTRPFLICSKHTLCHLSVYELSGSVLFNLIPSTRGTRPFLTCSKLTTSFALKHSHLGTTLDVATLGTIQGSSF